MSAINISLPHEQVSFVDSLVRKHGFANRSEFIRSIVRLLRQKPHIAQEAAVFPFVAALPNQSVKAIIADMAKTKKYSKAFLSELETGLKQSDYFKQ